MNALHGKCHTLEERQPSDARFPLICMFVFRSAPVLYRGVRDAIVFLRALFFGRLSFDDRSLFYARLLFGLLLPYAKVFRGWLIPRRAPAFRCARLFLGSIYGGHVR